MKKKIGCLTFLLGGMLIMLCGVIFLLYQYYTVTAARLTSPLVEITSVDPEGTVPVNQSVVVFARASDPDGIASSELWVNGTPVATQINPVPSGQSQFFISQAWIPVAAGNYLIFIKAADTGGETNQSEPIMVQAYDRSGETDPDEFGSYITKPGDTMESIADAFGTNPEDLLERNPDAGSAPEPGTALDVPPEPEGESGGGTGVPPAEGGEDAPRVEPPPPAPPTEPGESTPAEPASPPWWSELPLPDRTECIFSPELCSPPAGDGPILFAPTNVSATLFGECNVFVEWDDNNEAELGDKIYRITMRPRFRMDLVAILDPIPGTGRINYVVPTPPNGTFFYAVSSYNAAGEYWSAPSNELSTECRSVEESADISLAVEALTIEVPGTFDRLYCYASLTTDETGRIYERVPGSDGFIELEGGNWNIADHFSGSNKRIVNITRSEPLVVAAECLGWQADNLVSLGHFENYHPPAEWDGRVLVGSGRDYTVNYRILPTWVSYDESGSSLWPLINPGAWAPYNLRATDEWDPCPSEFPRSIECSGTQMEPGITWDYSPSPGAPEQPLYYKILVRDPGDLVWKFYYRTPDGLNMSAPQLEGCGQFYNYNVTAVLGYDPMTGEEIQTYPSESIQVESLSTCPAELEITLDRISLFAVDDGIADSDYEAYGWFSFNGHRIRWNDHCEPGLIFDCAREGPNYTFMDIAGYLYYFGNQFLNDGSGWRGDNNIFHIPINDGEPLSVAFYFKDHDGGSPDDYFCGMRTAAEEIVLPGRSQQEWLNVDQELFFNGARHPGYGHCNLWVRVRGVPAR